jgi:oxygen-independent coproporphyrinogen-3 oxidase
LPHQTEDSWRRSLERVAGLEVPHVSVYLFEVDEDSRLGSEVLVGGTRYGACALPGDEQAVVLFETAVDRLNSLGYRQYEISNFARPGAQSRHNRKYWTFEPYIGFGLDAHSFDGVFRWSNPDTLAAYLSRTAPPQRTPVDLTEERFFIGLRLLEGIQPTAQELERFADPIQRFTSQGLLLREGARLRLSPQAVLISNEIFQEFISA